jgi:DNA-binding transcriptional regulator YhcF (GntR family)
MTLNHDTRLNQELAIPIYQQIYEHLRSAILAGQLKRGTKLPSTRALADQLGVSRNTILNTYVQLTAEGYLERVEGKGTFVTQFLPEDFFHPAELSAGSSGRVSSVRRRWVLSDSLNPLVSHKSSHVDHANDDCAHRLFTRCGLVRNYRVPDLDDISHSCSPVEPPYVLVSLTSSAGSRGRCDKLSEKRLVDHVPVKRCVAR